MPDTTAYLYLALAAVTLIVAIYIGSMAIRYRNLEKDLELIEELRREN